MRPANIETAPVAKAEQEVRARELIDGEGARD